MKEKDIKIGKFRGNNSSSFTGRPQGKNARKELHLDNIEEKFDKVKIIIPESTTSFNPSFFLGMFYESIKKLGVKKFNDKYQFVFEDKNSKTINFLNKNIQEGLRHAKNEIESEGGLLNFLKRKHDARN